MFIFKIGAALFILALLLWPLVLLLAVIWSINPWLFIAPWPFALAGYLNWKDRRAK
jgi:hypothetical protein